ncbi:MFS transporter [Pandoraea pnomenusa]|uniref:MFS transporter n=1 Tax=Pandoraea pnomenusa TaxID=93220 RepID=UPI0009B8618E|nr:MFS transporter [Pandoraea pnomenusa]
MQMEEPGSKDTSAKAATAAHPYGARLTILLLGNALMRIAGGASSVLTGLFLADMAKNGAPVNTALVGTLGTISFVAEVAGALPMGLLSDALSPRALMTGGAVIGAAAMQMFGMGGSTGIFFLSRAAEGLSAAATAPPMLAHLTDMTDRNPPLRARVMSYFEVSLLAGLGFGGLLGSELWRVAHRDAFTVLAVAYLLCSALLHYGTAGSRAHDGQAAIAGFWRALSDHTLRRLAPVWVCVNAIIGLWLGPTLSFLMASKPHSGQFLAGIFAEQPQRMGWLLLGYALVFGTGVSLWSVVLPRVPLQRVLRIALVAMLCVCAGLLMLNHSGAWSPDLQWAIGMVTAVGIMVESGFTPAALALLTGIVGAQAGQGAAMGIYSMLLGIGAIGGSLLAAGLGRWLAVDGLILGTLAMALVALVLLNRLRPEEAFHVAR